MVADLALDTLSDTEVIQFLRVANKGAYDTDAMPEQWNGVFDEMAENPYA